MNEADRLLMQAALDGETSAPALIEFEQRLAREPDLAAAYAELQGLRAALRAAPVVRAPEALRSRMQALSAPASASQSAPPARAVPSPWRAVAASVAALGIGLAIGLSAAPRRPDIDREILDGHLRGLISSHPVDVVSSDQHTVKPWFAGRLSVAPATPDLAAAGFPLEGGRIDVIAGEPAPTLVYRANKHTVSVTRLPSAVASSVSGVARREIDGHTLETWRQNDATYVATSDAAPAEVDALVAAFRKDSATP